jgi:tripartite-type tricarboxylate transporter receptor subunit TctC
MRHPNSPTWGSSALLNKPITMGSSQKALIAILIATYVVSASAAADSAYPNKPIRLITPQGAGSGVDIVGRIVAARMSELLGRPLIVDNRPGAGGTIGIETALKAAPDGYTLVQGGSASLTVAPYIYNPPPYDPLKDLAPISQLYFNRNLLVVHPSLPANTVKQLIALMKAQPDQFNMASAGMGSVSHLAGVMFMQLAGVSAVHVAYKGGGASVMSVVGNEAQWALTPLAAPLPHVRSGKLRALAVTGENRSSLLPEVPTVAEAGLPRYNSVQWGGILAPRGTSRFVIDKLNEAIVKTVASPNIKEQFVLQGVEPASSTPEVFARFLREEYQRMGPVIKAAGIKVE